MTIYALKIRVTNTRNPSETETKADFGTLEIGHSEPLLVIVQYN